MIHKHVHYPLLECKKFSFFFPVSIFIRYFSWVSGIVDVQCAFVWAACLRYCMNSSLKQRLRNGTNPQQAFLLASYLSTSRGQCDFYEVTVTTGSSTNSSSFILDYDLWTSSRKIIMPNPPISHSHDASVNTQLPYDFEFRHVYDGPKMRALLGAHTGNISLVSPQQPPMRSIATPTNPQLPSDISFLSAVIPSDDEDDVDHHSRPTDRIQQEHHHHQTMLSSPNTNGSLFGVPRLPPQQSTHQSPSWDSISTAPMATPKWIAPVPAVVSPLSGSLAPLPPPPLRFSSPAPSTIAPSTVVADAQWKEEMLEKMQAYDAHIQSLNALIAQLLTAQKQQEQRSSMTTPARESIKCDVAVQSEPPSPCTSDDVGESASMVKSNRNTPPSPKIEQIPHYQQQQQTPIMTTTAANRVRRITLHLQKYFVFIFSSSYFFLSLNFNHLLHLHLNLNHHCPLPFVNPNN